MGVYTNRRQSHSEGMVTISTTDLLKCVPKTKLWVYGILRQYYGF